MGARVTQRGFLMTAGGTAVTIPLQATSSQATETFQLAESTTTASAPSNDRIVDIHVHFDENNPNFIQNLVTLAKRTNLTGARPRKGI